MTSAICSALVCTPVNLNVEHEYFIRNVLFSQSTYSLIRSSLTCLTNNSLADLPSTHGLAST